MDNNRSYPLLNKSHAPSLGPRWPWREIFMPEAPCRARYILMYNHEKAQEVPTNGLPSLAAILPISGGEMYLSRFLPTPEEGYQQFGLLGFPPQTPLQDEELMTLKTLLSARWVFALEWSKNQPAWEALLSSEDHLNPLVISLSPAYVLPALFVARMADLPRETIFDTVKAWTWLLDEVSDPLHDLIAALYLRWLDGPSQAAQALRAKSAEDEEEETLDEETRAIYQDALHAFEHIFGTARLEALQHAERLVPAVLRLLDDVSGSLWDTAMSMSEEQRSALWGNLSLRALLPIALWRPEALHSLDIDDNESLSLENIAHMPLAELYEAWYFRSTEPGISGNEG